MEQGFDKVPGDDFDDFAEGEVDEDFGEFDDGFADDALSRDDGMERVSSHASQSLLAARVVSKDGLDQLCPSFQLDEYRICGLRST